METNCRILLGNYIIHWVYIFDYTNLCNRLFQYNFTAPADTSLKNCTRKTSKW